MTTAELVELADNVGRRWRLPGADADDVCQLARLAALEAVAGYRPELGVPLRAFVIGCVRRRLITALVVARRRRHDVLTGALRFEAPAGDDAGTVGDCFEDPRADVLELVHQRERLGRLRAAAARLTPLERAALGEAVNGRPYSNGTKVVDNGLQRARAKLRAAAA